MSPILVRPVREQLEHDRIIRLLQAKYKRKFEVGINPGNERAAAVGAPVAVYPDLVLYSPERGRRVLGVVEIETTESVNTLEAMSQWVQLGRQPAPFYLYVPVGMVDVARRLCEDYQVSLAEMWTFSGIGDQMRFVMVYRSPTAPDITMKPAAPKPAAPPKPAAKTAAKPAARTARTPARPIRAAKTAAASRRSAAGRATKTVPARPRPKAAKAAPARKAQRRK